MNFAKLHLTLTGTSPLVPAPKNSKRLEQICYPRKGYVPPPPKEQAVADQVTTEDGHPAIPNDALVSALLQAIETLDLPERHPLLPTWGDVLRRTLTLDGPGLVPIEGKATFWVEAVPHRSGGRTAAVSRGRYRFDRWALRAVLNYPTDIISETQLLQLATTVGADYGLGLFRSEAGGGHGRFTVATVAAEVAA